MLNRTDVHHRFPHQLFLGGLALHSGIGNRLPRKVPFRKSKSLATNSRGSKELREHLKKELARRSDWSVFIYGDEEFPFQAVVKVVDVVNGLGGRPVLVGSKKLSKRGKKS